MRGIGTLFRGGYCCRKECREQSSVARDTGLFESWRGSVSFLSGGAVETSAGRLPFKGIIHVAGINLLWRSSEHGIRDCVRSALTIARERGYRSIAFPLIGAGTGGVPSEKALDVMQDEVRKIAYDGEVRIVRYKPAG